MIWCLIIISGKALRMLLGTEEVMVGDTILPLFQTHQSPETGNNQDEMGKQSRIV